MLNKLMGAAVSLKKPLKQDAALLSRVRQQYELLVRLVTIERGMRQQLLATEVYRYYKQSDMYDVVRPDLLSFLRQLGLGDRIKKTIALPQTEYEKLLRQQFMGLHGVERNVPLKTIQLYMRSCPEREKEFAGVLTPRDRALFAELSI